MLKSASIKKGIQYAIRGLPLAAIIVSSFLPLRPVSRQLLILASLIWLQVLIVFEVFLAR
jgi:hypothetical protein